MFENKLYKGIYYSRFVASWCKIGGPLDWRFREFLNCLTLDGEPIPKDVVDKIYNYGTDGKLELETTARKLLLCLYREEERRKQLNKLYGIKEN